MQRNVMEGPEVSETLLAAVWTVNVGDQRVQARGSGGHGSCTRERRSGHVRGKSIRTYSRGGTYGTSWYGGEGREESETLRCLDVRPLPWMLERPKGTSLVGNTACSAQHVQGQARLTGPLPGDISS